MGGYDSANVIIAGVYLFFCEQFECHFIIAQQCSVMVQHITTPSHSDSKVVVVVTRCTCSINSVIILIVIVVISCFINFRKILNRRHSECVATFSSLPADHFF